MPFFSFDFLARIVVIVVLAVFEGEFHSNIIMGLNRSKDIPNSTDVWWELHEARNDYRFIPSCSSPRLRHRAEIELELLFRYPISSKLFDDDAVQR